MKKTLTVNISGTVFHIEEDAYDQLSNYLKDIRERLAGSPGHQEIMADIEARIAELFGERTKVHGEVVTMADVAHVMGVMGRPEDYVSGEQEEPVASTEAGDRRRHRRLFRDPDDRWVGGVLSGIAAYIGTDPIWLRLIFIMLLLIGVGSPFIIYLLLWILVPAANTTAERLMMEGEPVTVDNLKRAFEEGTQRVAREAEDLGKRWSGPPGRKQRAQFRAETRRAASAAGIVVQRVIGVGLLLLGIAMAIGLIGAIVGGGTFTLWGFGDAPSPAPWDLITLIFTSAQQAGWFLGAVILLMLIPVIAVLTAALYLLMDLAPPRWFGIALAPIWVVALFVAIPIGLSVAKEFNRHETLVTTVTLQQPSDKVLYLRAMDDQGSGQGWNMKYKHGVVNWDFDGLVITDDSVMGAWARLDVRASPDSLFHLRLERRTQGPSQKASLYRSEHIGYATDQRDSVLALSPWLSFPKEDKIRGQRLRFVVLVPEGKAVHFDAEMGFMLDDVKNVTNTLDKHMVGRTWTMTEEGLIGTTPDSLPHEDASEEAGVDVVVNKEGQRSRIRVRWPRGRSEEASSAFTATQHLPNILALLRPRI